MLELRKDYPNGFNPCFNGFTSLTSGSLVSYIGRSGTVSILVLMDSLL